MKYRVAIVRGKFLNKYEMQFFEPLMTDFELTAFGSMRPYHDRFIFSVKKLPSPMDLPDFPYKMPLLNRLFTDAHVLFGLRRNLDGFDLVHSAETYFSYTQQCLDAKRDGRVKHVIATVLENIPFNNEGIQGRLQYKNRAFTELDHIIALTERTKLALLLEGADENKITVISHFIDTKRFRPAERRQGNTPLTILFCGRLEAYKGIYELLYAFAALVHERVTLENGIRLVYVGDGSEKKNLMRMEHRLGLAQHVSHMTVAYEKMPEVYQAADIYVAPSTGTETWQEQYNTTLLEAQASGLPIVTSRSGGIPENVGDAAIFVNPGDVLSLFEALKMFVKDFRMRRAYGRKARERAVSVHDISIGARKLADVYNRVLGV